mgnify:CR=1 FL=1
MSLSGLLLGASVVLASLAQILLKHGMTRAADRAGHTWLRPLCEPLVLAGMSAQVLLTCFWLVVLSHIDVSLAFPVLSLSYVAVVAYSGVFMGDTVGFRRWCGVLLIVTGVGVLAYGH